MTKNLLRRIQFGLALMLIPILAHAWWNDSWPSRKQLTVDASATGADVQETLNEFPVLVRLHAGNFGFFFDLAENGKDLRFMLDDKTALKHHIEKIDALTELGLVWVKLPVVRGGVGTDGFAMYYGNANAVDGSDPKGIYDVNQALVFHFAEGEVLPLDATAYGVNAAESKASIDNAGLIGAAAKFDGQGGITVNANPALELNVDNGFTFNSWVKFDQNQANATLFKAQDDKSLIRLVLQDASISANYQVTGGPLAQTAGVNLTPGQWHHIALVLQKESLQLYIDGQSVAQTSIQLVGSSPALLIGDAFSGWLDEVQVAKQARTPDWLKLQYRSQSPDHNVLNFGQDESAGAASGPNYALTILQSLTTDGWVVIGLCGAMLVMSLLVMFTKGFALRRAQQDNVAFLKQYRRVETGDLESLDRDETEEEQELEESEFLKTLLGEHDHFQSSPIYHVYHAGVQELKKRLGDNQSTSTLSVEALNVVRARLDAAVVQEYQKLNKNMVLLTIAISGGPFLGLFGTVMGVMITFAVIAATGDVNINTIAPGISAALATTVAGLLVAIPTLFAYNYLLYQVKTLTADMRIFTDEFLAVVSERIADRNRGE